MYMVYMVYTRIYTCSAERRTGEAAGNSDTPCIVHRPIYIVHATIYTVNGPIPCTQYTGLHHVYSVWAYTMSTVYGPIPCIQYMGLQSSVYIPARRSGGRARRRGTPMLHSRGALRAGSPARPSYRHIYSTYVRYSRILVQVHIL